MSRWTFEGQEPNRTLVVLEHSGWEASDDPASARAEYDRGWPVVLDRFVNAASQPEGGDAFTWVALMHRPGPRAPKEGAIFDHPMFAEHVKFLSRMRADGLLVAAGPLLDHTGEGMTILRLRGADQLAEAARLATTQDSSVKEGFFEVTVRPWRVMMSQ